jgi:tetratricopeptide (TPR) repeat protein
MVDYELALADVNRLIEPVPDNAAAFSFRGTMLADLQRYEEAVNASTKALRLQLDDPWDYVRGKAILGLTHIEHALADLNRAINLAATYDWYFYWRGLAHLLANNEIQANADFAKAIDLATHAHNMAPKDWRNTFNLAIYHLAAIHRSEAACFVDEAISCGTPYYRMRGAIADLTDFPVFFPGHEQAISLKQRLEVAVDASSIKAGSTTGCQVRQK